MGRGALGQLQYLRSSQGGAVVCVHFSNPTLQRFCNRCNPRENETDSTPDARPPRQKQDDTPRLVKLRGKAEWRGRGETTGKSGSFSMMLAARRPSWKPGYQTRAPKGAFSGRRTS